MSARLDFLALFFRIPTLGPLAFPLLSHSFVFAMLLIFRPSCDFRTLDPKTRGSVSLSVLTNSTISIKVRSSLFAIGCRVSTVDFLLLLFLFTAHSQSCYPTFTHPSPSLVTMNPGPGSNGNTMSTAISPRTVHFYRCDQLREMPS